MNYLKLLVAGTFALVFFTACPQKEDELVFDILGEHTLKFEESLSSDDNSFSMTFSELVSDSRCPIGVACIWEGLAEVRFSLEIDGESYTLNLTAHEGHPEKAVGMLDVYTITLLNVAPDANTEETPPEDYVVTFTIEE